MTLEGGPIDVPFVDLRAQTAPIREEIQQACDRVMDAGSFILGPQVDEFEAAFARYCGVPYAVGVDSGLSALEISLHALGIGTGDEVITQANTFVATVASILHVGARPVLVDCDRAGVIDLSKLEAAISGRTRAIVPVHLFGRLGPIHEILELASSKGIFVIEDAAQAHGARLAGQSAGAFGVAGAYSFYPAKNLGAMGDGGIIVTVSKELAETAKAMRNYGQVAKNLHAVRPLNRRLDTLQAAILTVKLPHLDAWNERRRQVAERYRRGLADLPLVAPQAEDDRERHVYHLFPVVVAERDRLRTWLHDRGVATGVHYPTPPHLQPVLNGLGYGQGAFPEAEWRSVHSLSLPIFETMKDEQVDRVAEVIRAFQ